MKAETLFNTVKQFLFIIVPLSLTSTYLGVFSYYLKFQIDISSYLEFKDLTIIYLKYTVLSMLYIIIVYAATKKFLNTKNPENFWDKPIGASSVKRRLVPVIIILGMVIYIMVINEIARNFILIITLSIGLLSLSKSSVYTLFLTGNDNNHDNIENDVITTLLILTITTLTIPVIAGTMFHNIQKPENIIIHLENGAIIDTQNPAKFLFIGKTSSYVFIEDKVNHSTKVYPIDKISEIEYSHKIKNHN